MDEFDQYGVSQDNADEQAHVTPDHADEQAHVTGGEPEVVEEQAPAEPVEPTVQESMTFDDIVATAAAEAGASAAAEAPIEDAVAEEAAVGEIAVVASSEELDDMVEALKEGAAAKAAEGEADADGQGPVAESADDEAIAQEAGSEDEAHEEIEDEYAGVALVRDRLGAKLPAWAYAGVWVVFAAVMTYLLWPTATKPFIEQPDYAYMVVGGLALAVAGPVVALLTWLFARMGTTASERIGLVRAVWMRCMLATVFGVAIWWLALYALDLHRKGVIG
jgi:hypothetical protein